MEDICLEGRKSSSPPAELIEAQEEKTQPNTPEMLSSSQGQQRHDRTSMNKHHSRELNKKKPFMDGHSGKTTPTDSKSI